MDRCLNCNKYIPEGNHICSFCSSNVTMLEPIVNKPVEELTKGELTAEVMQLTKAMMGIECKLSEITIMFIDLMKKVSVMK